MGRNLLQLLAFLLILPASAQAEKNSIYLFPVQVVGGSGNEGALEYADNMCREEMAAYIWLDVVHPGNLLEKHGESAKPLLKCSTIECAKPYLSRLAIKRAVRVEAEEGAKGLKVVARVHAASGAVLNKVEKTERGGVSDLPYMMISVIERLFKAEFNKYGKSLTRVLDMDTTVTSGDADRFLTLGDEALDAGMFDIAVEHYETALKSNGGLVAAHVGMGRALLALEKPGEAMLCVNKIRHFDKNLAWASLLEAQIHLVREQTTKAISSARKAITQSPRWIDAHRFLGQALVAAGRFDEARKALEKAKKIDPEDPLVQDMLAGLKAPAEPGGEAKAEFPDDPETLVNLAKGYEKKKEWKKAEEVYMHLVTQMENCAPCWYNLGFVREEAKNLKGAFEAYERAVEIDSELTDALFAAGMAAWNLKELRAAEDYLVDYVEKEKGNQNKDFVKTATNILKEIQKED